MRSTVAEEPPATTPLSQHATLPAIPIAVTVKAEQLKQFALSQPRKMGLAAAGIVGSILLIALVRPLLSPRPASNPSIEHNAASSAPASSPDPSPSAPAWSNKGTALIQLDRASEAVAAFDRAIELDPNLAEAWNNRGAALWQVRRFEEALASVERAIQIQPNYADALGLRQQMRQQLGR
jgi:tetratricopeptide (TPR) repeat protein